MRHQKKGVTYSWPIGILFTTIALVLVFSVFSLVFRFGLEDKSYEFSLVATSSDLDVDIQLNTLLMSPVSYQGHTVPMREVIKRAALAYKDDSTNEAARVFNRTVQERLNLMEHRFDDVVVGDDRDELRNCRKKYTLTLFEGDATDVEMDELFTELTILRNVQSRPQHYGTIISNPYRYYITDKKAGCYEDANRGFSASRRTLTLPDGEVLTVQLLSVMDSFRVDNR